MNETVILLSTMLVFIITLIVSGRFFYLLEVRTTARKLLNSLKLDVLNINYSFEQMVFFHSLPSNIQMLRESKKEDIIIKYDYELLTFDQFKGIKLFIENNDESLFLGYLPINDFRFPILDLLLKNGDIDERSYHKVAIYKLIHPNTLEEISAEVYKQIHLGRYKVSQ